MISSDNATILQRLKDDFPHYAEKCLKIRPKAGGLIPFKLNRVQRHIHEAIERQLKDTGKVRMLILKARQPGCSTLVEGRYYHKVVHRFGVRAFILTHKQEATDNQPSLASARRAGLRRSIANLWAAAVPALRGCRSTGVRR